MSTVNKAKVWVKLKVKLALGVSASLDAMSIKPFYTIIDNEDHAPIPNGYRHVGFNVPKGMTVQEALVLMAKLAPEGTEIFAS